MTEGFAAHLILVPGARYKCAMLLVDENHALKEIRPLDRETPFTRFYDGALLVLRNDATPEAPGVAPVAGDRISIWKLYPYNLPDGCELPDTRCMKLI
ncbi:MAG: hypothetical protein ACRCSQ_10295 [Bacteroidales bacterium]